ncbi:hypothetical protein MMC25_007182 [Agyrium rufum]|nr:hypothetical protein [Agyrium rufum]
MAELDLGPQFGAQLKACSLDGFRPVNTWISNGIAWLDDIQAYYRERAAIEKEYGAKLSALAKKYHERKAKKIGPLSVGDTPTLTPGSLESASLTTWTTQLSTLEKRATEHDRFAGELAFQIAEPLKSAATRYEELRKSHADYAAKLEKERDSSYATLKREKGRYDGVCQEVESKRKKIESSYDSSKTKAQNSYQQQLSEMHNVKNTYLININVTNKQKEKYYHEYVPDLLDELSETRVGHLNAIWIKATQLELDTSARCTEHCEFLKSEIPRNVPRLDSLMFMQHNVAAWQEPSDFIFEPSPVWLDDSAMAVDEIAKIFLRNILGRSKGQIGELKRDVDGKRREIEKARQIRQNIREGRDKRDEVEVVRAIFLLQDNLHAVERQRTTVEVETATITAAVGDISLGAQNHNFRSQTFKIPTNCDLCGDRIWGLSAKGFDCKDCGYTCHNKCELKVPADCPGEQTKDEKKKLKAERQAATSAAPAQTNGGSPPDGVAELPVLSRSNTMNSLSSGYAASAHRSVSGASKPPLDDNSAELKPAMSKIAPGRKRIVAPPPTQYISELPASNGGSTRSQPRAKVAYSYQASGDGEVTVDDGLEVTVVEPDDGSGWTTISTSRSEGVVPTSYLEMLPDQPVMNHSTGSPYSPVLNSPRPQSSYSDSSNSLHTPASTSTTSQKKRGPAVAPKRGAKKLNYVEALYDYDGRTDAEWSMIEGEKFVLVTADQGDGWAEVEKGGVVKSVPANYVKSV